MDVNNVSIMSEEFRRMRQFVDVLQVCRVTSRVEVAVYTSRPCSELHSQLLNDSSMASRSLFGMGRSNDTGGFISIHVHKR